MDDPKGTCDNQVFNILSRDQFSKIYTKIDSIGQGAFSETFKAVDKKNNRVVAIKFTERSDIESEVSRSCDIHRRLYEYTHGFTTFYDFGMTTHETANEWGMTLGYLDYHERDPDKRVIFYPGDKMYFATSEVLEPIGFSGIYNPPLDFKSIRDMSSQREVSDIMFETAYAIVILNLVYGDIHGDLHIGNVMLRRVNYTREYNINGQVYTVRNQYMPVIIDLGVSIRDLSGECCDSELYELFWSFSKLLADDFEYPPNIVQAYKSNDPGIVTDPVFEYLKSNPTYYGEVVRILKPIQIHEGIVSHEGPPVNPNANLNCKACGKYLYKQDLPAPSM